MYWHYTVADSNRENQVSVYPNDTTFALPGKNAIKIKELYLKFIYVSKRYNVSNAHCIENSIESKSYYAFCPSQIQSMFVCSLPV
jgi:hypothetical protein